MIIDTTRARQDAQSYVQSKSFSANLHPYLEALVLAAQVLRLRAKSAIPHDAFAGWQGELSKSETAETFLLASVELKEVIEQTQIRISDECTLNLVIPMEKGAFDHMLLNHEQLKQVLSSADIHNILMYAPSALASARPGHFQPIRFSQKDAYKWHHVASVAHDPYNA